MSTTDAQSPGSANFITTKSILLVALGLTFFHLYTSGISMYTAWIQRDVHLVLMMMMVFLVHPLRKRANPTVFDWLLILLSIASGLYIIFFYQDIVDRLGIPTTPDLIFGGIMIVVVLEATRRATGWVLVGIALVFLVYTMVGPWLPGLLAHKGYSVQRIISQMYLTTEGIFGIPLGVSANYIFLFIFLTTMLEELGMGKFLLDLAMSVMGRFTGGPAKTAVLGSGLMGSLTGSAVANVVGTGAFTIPLMKSSGYRSHFAGAVEACASAGGQLMPPIMGAAAFIIAEFLGIPYIHVVIAAIIPALLYYLCILFSVHYEASRLGLKGLPRKELPSLKQVLKTGGHFLLPLFALIYFLGVVQYSPIRSAFYAIICMFVISFVKWQSRINWARFKEGSVAASKRTITVAMACATAGLVIGCINLSGLGLKISSLIISASGGVLWIALILTAVMAIILGMGLPATAAYIVAGTMAAPALVKMGLYPLSAHLFVFYFAIISAITPPIALAAYGASAIAEADPLKIAVTACKIGIAAFIIPFMFAYDPLLVAHGKLINILWASTTAIIGIASLAGGAIGYVWRPAKFYERILFIGGSLMLLYTSVYSDFVGILIIAFALTIHVLRARRQERTRASA